MTEPLPATQTATVTSDEDREPDCEWCYDEGCDTCRPLCDICRTPLDEWAAMNNWGICRGCEREGF